MAFSLSNWFKGKPGAPGSENPDENAPDGGGPASAPATTAPAQAAPPISSSVRKVVPNSVQPVNLRSNVGGMRPMPVQLPVSAPPSPALTVPPGRISPVVPPARGKISFGAPTEGSPVAGHAPEPPPAAVPDVTVSLEVGDFIDRLPPGFVSAEAVDRQRRVDFRASELYSDLTKGRASVPASVIYQKCPELFSRAVSDEEDTEVQLPLQKLVEQMSQAFQTRPDQVAEDNVGEIETPFLQVAMEDSARLPKAAGTTAGALRSASPPAAAAALNEPLFRPHRTGQISTISVPKVAPEPAPMISQAAPSANTVSPINAAKRPPSTVRASVAGGKIRLSGPTVPNRMTAVPMSAPAAPAVPAPESAAPAAELPPSASQRILPPLQVAAAPTASPSLQVSKKTARIQIPPISLRGNGPGPAARPAAPSAVSVQASPVPVRPAPNAEPAAPAVTFRSSPPPASAKPMPHSFAPPAPRPAVPPPAFPASPTPPAAPSPAPVDERKIHLSLAAVLRGLPMSSLTVDPNNVPDDVRVTLPFALVEPQLSQGRVAVPQALFSASLPESHREVLAANSGLSEIPLPLQEVFQNLPPAALAIRQDQVIEEVGNLYPTPFSQKAEEDAQRLGAGSLPKPSAAAPAAPEASAPEAAPAPETPTDHPLPADEPVAESKAPGTAIPAPESADKEEEEASGKEFANLFVEEPAPSPRDIPLDFSGDKQTGPEESAPVEAKTTEEEKPALEPSTAPVPEERVEEPKAAVSKDESSETAAESKPEAKTEATPEPIRTDLVPAAEEKREEPAGQLELPVAEAPALPPAAGRAEGPAAPEGPATDRATTASAAPTPATVQRNGHAPADAKPNDSVLQTLFMTEDDLDAKAVVRHVTALPGVEGCAVMFEDGLQLAGNFPSESDAEGFSAMAPPFFKRTRNFAGEVNLGALRAFTLYTESGLVSLFMHDQICLSVRHSGRGFLPGVREKLEAVTRELARMYAATE